VVSKHWHDWALQQRGGASSFRSARRWRVLHPPHAVQHAWNRPGMLAEEQQQAAVLECAVGAGDVELAKWLWHQTSKTAPSRDPAHLRTLSI
jgi:hypothetical protein